MCAADLLYLSSSGAVVSGLALSAQIKFLYYVTYFMPSCLNLHHCLCLSPLFILHRMNVKQEQERGIGPHVESSPSWFTLI